MDLLLSRGAAIDGMHPGLTIVAGALANGCPEAARSLVDRGARVDDVATAAGLARLDLVMRLAEGATKEQLEKALIAASWHGTIEIVEYLLDRGVNVTAPGTATVLHGPAGRADLEMTKMLIERGAPLEAKNSFGGTVLSGTLWFFHHSDPANAAHRDYPAVIDMLLAAGAKDDLYPEMKGHIDEVYRRAGRTRV
jgi:hypothetical protein